MFVDNMCVCVCVCRYVNEKGEEGGGGKNNMIVKACLSCHVCVLYTCLLQNNDVDENGCFCGKKRQGEEDTFFSQALSLP